jgi:hypothetical protein
MSSLRALGTTNYIICGPSPALARFVVNLHPGAGVHCVAWPEDLTAAATGLPARSAEPAAGQSA